jgi:solute:Na+ symporter, SSS family
VTGLPLAVIGLYLAVVLAVGLAAGRLSRGTAGDFFTASRTIGPFVLLMSLFGTHMTAFSLLGASGEAYHLGVGVFALMASSSALVVPVVTLLLAPRAWAAGRRAGFLTQVEMVATRFESRSLGLVLFAVLTLLLVPYLLIGVLGGGITLAEITGGLVPSWLGSLLVCGVVLTYVAVGGVRGASWANTFQTLVFMVLGAVAFTLILSRMGGLTAALSRVDPSLLMLGDHVSGAKLLSYTLLPLSVAAFPHLFLHWLTAESPRTFKLPVIAYPLCLLPVWIPSVLLGVLGTDAVPGLQGPAANSVLIRLIDLFAPGVLAGLLAAGVLAAVMSSLDSQILALSTLFTRTWLSRRSAQTGRSVGDGSAHTLRLGRLFVALIVLAVWLLSLVTERSIFRLGVWSFSGFAALAPLIFATLYWRRATRAGAWASLLTAALTWAGFFLTVSDDPTYSLGGTGLLPVVLITALSAVALVVVSLFTRPPSAGAMAPFFPREDAS